MLSSSQTNPKLGGNGGRKKEKAVRAVPRSKPTTFLKDQQSFSHFLQLSERSRPQNEKLMTTPHPLSLSFTLSFLPSLLPLSLWPSCLASNVSYLSECSNWTFQHAPVHPETRLFWNHKRDTVSIFILNSFRLCNVVGRARYVREVEGSSGTYFIRIPEESTSALAASPVVSWIWAHIYCQRPPALLV